MRIAIALVAERGYAGTSLARIAEAAGISKAAVLYHFASKNAVIEGAYQAVIQGIVAEVGSSVEAAESPAAAIDAYISSTIGYMADHPEHVRMLIEALAKPGETGIDDTRLSVSRWGALANLIEASQADGTYQKAADSRIHAIMLIGSIDAVVAESLNDTRFDLRAAAASVVTLARHAARASERG